MSDDGGIQWWQTVGLEQHREWIADYERTEKQAMGRYARETGGKDFQQAPAGTTVGRCFRIIDLGTQTEEYMGKELVRAKIMFSWELPNENMDTDDGEKPFIVSRFFTHSLSEKSNLRPFLNQWRSKAFTDEELKGFDLATCAGGVGDKPGAPGLLTIIHNEKGKAQVASCIALPKGMTCPPPINKKQIFFFPDEPLKDNLKDWDPKAFEAIPEGIRKIAMQSYEYKAIAALLVEHKKNAAMGAVTDMPDDEIESDIPF